ncbi:hypothetical protein BDV93DRAFT_523733 [Ceratobasidium sp. AG-I]|nr:hypothetical protein BDV93DRAFT_523733 [Ceratobasidium sp. AG-I]
MIPVSRPRAGVPTDYSSQSYWTSRFAQESTFEWLSSSSTLLPRISSALDDIQPSKIIHIGCGNSELSLDVRQLLQDRRESTDTGPEVTNIDYAPPALERMKAAEMTRFGDTKMRWEAVDLLDWSATSQSILKTSDESLSLNTKDDNTEPVITPTRLLILDKSTADAISCGPDIHTPLLGGEASLVHPTEALALHLGALAAEGSVWLALSYSSTRFDFLPPTNGYNGGEIMKQRSEPKARHLWTIDRIESIPTETEPNKPRENVHAPQVYHTLFTLKRTARNVFS